MVIRVGRTNEVDAQPDPALKMVDAGLEELAISRRAPPVRCRILREEARAGKRIADSLGETSALIPNLLFRADKRHAPDLQRWRACSLRGLPTIFARTAN
jgi:hypothetical protein